MSAPHRLAALGLALALASGCLEIPPPPTDEGPVLAATTTLAPRELTWRSLAAGQRHTCALDGDGAIWCFGARDADQAGVGYKGAGPAPPHRLGQVPVARALAAGDDHTCALTLDDAVWCWGDGASGQGLVRGTLAGGLPIPLALPPPIHGLAAGGDTTCVIDSERAVQCWGALHDAAAAPATTTVPVPIGDLGPHAAGGPAPVVGLALGARHACAILEGGALRCWGDNTRGQLGDGTLSPSPNTARPVPDLAPVRAVAVGGAFTCALGGDAVVRCWGDNRDGAAGAQMSIQTVTRPGALALARPVVEVVAGRAHACARDDAGAVWCWGAASDGQLGPDEATGSSPRRVALPTRARVVGLGAGADHTCVFDTERLIVCWGAAGDGRLGRDLEEDEGGAPEPAPIAAPARCDLAPAPPCTRCGPRGERVGCPFGCDDGRCLEATALSVRHGGCVRLDDASLRCWGADGPARPDLPAASAVAVGLSHTCAVAEADGMIWCWGANRDAVTGLPAALAEVASPSPNGILGASALATGSRSSCAAMKDGRLLCWGRPMGERLLVGADASDFHTPRAVALDRPARAIAVGEGDACALVDEGGVRCFGDNHRRGLGDGTEAPRVEARAPEVLPDDGLVEVVASRWHFCARHTDGRAWCWGDEAHGALGVPFPGDVSSPVALDGVMGGPVMGLAVGASITCALVGPERRLRCIGLNADRRIRWDAPTTEWTLAPVDVGGLVGVAEVSVDASLCVRDAGGLVRCRGAHDGGTGPAWHHLAPAPVGALGSP